MNYLFKNTGRVCTVLALLATTMLSSCLKDNSPGSVDFSKSPALISWQYSGFSKVTEPAVMLPVGNFTYNLEVALSVSSVTLGSSVSASVAENDAAVTAAGYTPLPTSLYSMGSSVTIPAGQQLVKFPIVFKAGTIDFTKGYALYLTLSNGSGASIPSNLNTVLVVLKVKSIYEGNYTTSGQRTRFKGTTEASGVLDHFAISGTVPLATYTANTVIGQAGDSGSGETWALQVNATGATPYSVTVLPDPTAASGTTPSSFTQGTANGPSTYDPATKTFNIHVGYLNASGVLREIDETMVAQ